MKGWDAKLFIKEKDIKKIKLYKMVLQINKFTQQSKNKISNLFNGDKEKIKTLPDKILRKSLGFDF